MAAEDTWTPETLEASRIEFVTEVIVPDFFDGLRALWMTCEPRPKSCPCPRCDPDTTFCAYGIDSRGEAAYLRGSLYTPESPLDLEVHRDRPAWCFVERHVETSQEDVDWEPRSIQVPPTLNDLAKRAWDQGVQYFETRRWAEREQQEDAEPKIRYCGSFVPS